MQRMQVKRVHWWRLTAARWNSSPPAIVAGNRVPERIHSFLRQPTTISTWCWVQSVVEYWSASTFPPLNQAMLSLSIRRPPASCQSIPILNRDLEAEPKVQAEARPEATRALKVPCQIQSRTSAQIFPTAPTTLVRFDSFTLIHKGASTDPVAHSILWSSINSGKWEIKWKFIEWKEKFWN